MKLKSIQERQERPSKAAEVVAVAEQELPIRYRGGITDEEWDRFAAEARGSNHPGLRFILSQLCPERCSELDLSDDFFQRVKVVADQDEEYFFIPTIESLVDLSLLFPDRRAELGLDDDYFQRICQFFSQVDGNRRDKTALSLQIAYLYPDKRDQLPIDTDFDSFNELLPVLRDDDIWYQFAISACQATILYLQRRHELGITDDDLKHIQELQEEYRGTNRGEYLRFSFFLAVLSAKDIELTAEHGLVLKYDDPLKGAPDLPERKIT